MTNLIPLPPPPAVAFNITGYPIFVAKVFASSVLDSIPSPPGITGTPADFIVFFAVALSPIDIIISGPGPINVNPFSEQIFENSADSDKKPYPG